MLDIPKIEINEEYWAPRRSCLPPLDEHYHATSLLSRAVNEHLSGNADIAESLILEADIPKLHEWSEALWGGKKALTEEEFRYIHRKRKDPEKPSVVEKRLSRTIPIAMKRDLIQRDGYHCKFCSLPLIGRAALKVLRDAYPNAIRWGSANREKHSALYTMAIEYDHILPHCLGGENTLDNLVVACGPCNCARWDCTIAEYGLLDPRDFPPVQSDWDGLSRLKRD